MTAVQKPHTYTISVGRPDPAAPVLIATSRTEIAIRAGTTIRIDDLSYSFEADTPISVSDLLPGEDYGVGIDANGKPFASLFGSTTPLGDGWIGGFHFAPGGCAESRTGGDAIPAINPHSAWDAGFRFAGRDPRGMTLVEMPDGSRLWVDIYLLGTEHRKFGTSRCGATIADGRSLSRLNYDDAVAIYADHGKRLLTYDEFRAAAFGVTERSSADDDPDKAGLDAARTSRFGLMQATGNLWAWGTDGDPDDQRPSIFGGSWIFGSDAGSRFANLDYWGDYSSLIISARGAGDHLQLA